MSAQFRPVWLVTDPITGARSTLGFLVQDEAGVVFLPTLATERSSTASEPLATLVTELLMGDRVFDQPSIGLGPQVVFGEVAEVPQSAPLGRDWVATTLLSALAA